MEAATDWIIGCAVRVHRALGPGLLEVIHEATLCIEFNEIGCEHQRLRDIPVASAASSDRRPGRPTHALERLERPERRRCFRA